MTKKELQQLIKEEITNHSFNQDTMKKEELQKLQEALTDVMKYQMDEPDHEGEMAKSQMLKTMKYAADIMNMIDDTTELPAWVQSKLTKIASYIGAVKHHMESKTVRHVVTNMMESQEDIKLTDLLKKESVGKPERGDSGYVEKHKSIATVYDVLSGGKKVRVKLGKTGKKVVIDTKDIDILPESAVDEGFSSTEINSVKRQLSNYAKKYTRGDIDTAIGFYRGILRDIENERKKNK